MSARRRRSPPLPPDTLDEVISLADDFPAPSLEAWMALVGKTLAGAEFERRLVSRTADGIAIQPLYTPADAGPRLVARPQPNADPHRPWDLRTLVDHPDPARANADILHDLGNGANSILLRLDPTGERGVAVDSAVELGRALDGVLLDLAPVALDAGWMGPQAADWLATAAKSAPQAPLAFNLDPLSALAEAGASPGPIDAHLAAAARTAARHAETYPKASLFLASGRVAHEAGGTEAQELGFMAGAAVAYARALVEAGLPTSRAFTALTLGLATDGEYFMTIAKLRAARAIWSRLTQACGVDVPTRIEARSSRRMLARLDPWVNLLRLTAAGFGAGVGGADVVVLDAFTQPLGRPTSFARRQARNTQLVLMEEASLGRVADPAGGAWFIEQLTDQLARAGWAMFQRIEAAGGLDGALTSGLIDREVTQARAARERDLAKRKAGLIGVSEFPNLGEAEVEVESVDVAACARHAPDMRQPGADTICAPLTPWRASAAFEALRDRAAGISPPPRAWLATLGAPADYAARAGFARNLLAAGGIATEAGSVENYPGEAAPLVVLCGPDALYEAEGIPAARALKAAGAIRVELAGRPGSLDTELTAGGVDGFLFAGDDAVAALTRLIDACA